MDRLERIEKQIIAKQLSISADRITPEAAFEEELGADSLDTVDLVMALEGEFDVNISDDEAEKIGTFQDFIDYIKSYSAIEIA